MVLILIVSVYNLQLFLSAALFVTLLMLLDKHTHFNLNAVTAIDTCLLHLTLI